MRTTLTLDEDIAARLQDEVRRSGLPFKTVVNETLRTGLAQRDTAQKPTTPFKVEPLDMGTLPPGLSYDRISELLDYLDGPGRR